MYYLLQLNSDIIGNYKSYDRVTWWAKGGPQIPISEGIITECRKCNKDI